MAQRFPWMIKMLENIEHQNERIWLWGIEIAVKWRDANPFAVRTRWIYESFIRFHALHIAEFGEPVKKQTVAATDVENTQTRVLRSVAPQYFKNGIFTGTPPPMPRIKVAVFSGIF